MAWYKRAEERLVKFLMEDWQRRGSHFLHIGLHAPLIPEFFGTAVLTSPCAKKIIMP